MEWLHTLAFALVSRLAWSSLQACLLIGVLALIMRLLPRLPAAVRSMLWWLVGLQLLIGLACASPFQLRVLAPVSHPSAVHVVASDETATGMPAALAIAPTGRFTMKPSPGLPDWRVLVLLLWLGGIAAQLPRSVREWRLSRSVRRGAMAPDDAFMQRGCRRQAQALGLRRCPPLLVSARVESPQVVGLLHPAVVMPAQPSLSAREWEMALVHELAHLARRDLWLGWVAAAAQRLFFFHPAVAWAMREYALEREAACDALALRHSREAPQAYGRLLLRLGVAQPLHRGLAGASPTFCNLKRRLAMLQTTQGHSPSARRGAWLLVAIVALLGAVPYRLTAAAATPPAAVASPTMPDSALPPLAARSSATRSTDEAASTGAPHDHDIDITTAASDGGYAYALYDQGRSGRTVEVSGNAADAATARRLHADAGTPMFWFRRGDRAYLIRDPGYVARAHAVYEPVIAYWREGGTLEGDKWRIKGPLEGLRSRQRSVTDQRKALLADPQAPAAAARLADLAAQQRQLAEQARVLEGQLAALKPRLDAQALHGQGLVAQANQRASQLIDQALAQGLARDVSEP